MVTPPRFQIVEGPIGRILGSHRTVDVSIEEHSGHRSGENGAVSQNHTFVNSSREFAMLLEVQGRTLKLVSGDYIAAVEGDLVRAVCTPIRRGPMLVLDWHNVSRDIRFRTISAPLAGVMTEIGASIVLALVGIGLFYAFADQDRATFPLGVAVLLLLVAAYLATMALRGAGSLARDHAELDRLGGPIA